MENKLQETLKEFGQMVAEDFKKFGFVDKDGNIIMKSPVQQQKIGSLKDTIKQKIRNHYNKSELAESLHYIQPYFYDKTKSWWLWDPKKYKYNLVDESDILIMVSNESEANTINAKERSEILEAMRQFGRKKIPMEMKPNWLQFDHLIVDIETGEEFNASPDVFATNPIPYRLHKDRYIETPIMDKIFEEWVGPDKVKTLYEIIAYCLIPSYPIARIFCFIGGGCNGKSKFLELLSKFIGPENCCSTELDSLLNSRFEVTRLHKKLVCLMGETNFNEMKRTSILKKLSGWDPIGFEYKGKTPFEGKNYAKILIATNNLPATTDKTIGFYRRWSIIDFYNQFSEKKDILKTIPEEEFEILAVKSLMILKDLLETRSFHNEGTLDQRIKKFEEKSNPLQKFWDENIKEDGNEFIFKYELKKVLDNWLNHNKFRKLNEREINKFFRDKNVEAIKKQADFTNEGGLKPIWWAWEGIKFK